MSGPRDPIALPHRGWWLAYVALWVLIGLFLAIAELQHYLQRGGRHPWEPFLWELSSTLASALLTLVIFAMHRRLFEPGVPAWRRLAGHLAGAAMYVLAHSALMYGLRALAYAATGVTYEPGGVASILAYEGPKDAASYLLIVAICHGVLMALREQQRRRDWARLNEELAEARLARLQSQIQPHFLFNTLNLASSVMYEDVERADRILAELAELLRRSLDAGSAPTHSLAAELKLVEPFLSLMRQRFGSRLRVQVAVSESAARCEIPSLLLLAPLENAVTHGVAQSSAPVEVRVSGEVLGDRLELSVTDSAGQLARDARPGGIGLANTRERLAALYGDAASVALSRDAAGTVLRLRLPARSAA
ncbi:MAG TPA: histidine kinase [Albitalea sp.]|uniref:sensor histidine kinase n=1 Tax=Piscinibacter sp. TaxID=1903157 RepID=UPI002ED599E3